MGPHQRPHRSSASARPSSTTTRRKRRRSRTGRCGPTPSPRRGSTTGPITSTSPSRGCRRSTPTPATQFVGKPDGYGKQKRDEYTNVDYHAPSDEVKPDWDLTGAAEDATLFFAVGYRVANADTLSGMAGRQRVQGEAGCDDQEVDTSFQLPAARYQLPAGYESAAGRRLRWRTDTEQAGAESRKQEAGSGKREAGSGNSSGENIALFRTC